MTDEIRKEIVAYFRQMYLSSATIDALELIETRVRAYNRCKIVGEPEMTFDEMAELLHEKITTYRGKT